MRDEANAEFYNSDSATYDNTRWLSKAGIYTANVQQRIVEELTADWRNSEILEAGPGTGRFTIPMARKQNRITLVDISSEMLEVALANLAKEGLAACVSKVIQGSLYELPLEDGRFDYAICLNVLSHLEDSATAIKELARVVKPRGKLLINYPNLESFYWPAARQINARAKAVGQEVFSIWERPRDVSKRLEAAGLAVVARRGHAHVPRSLERYHLLPVIRGLDLVSRRAPLSRLAPIHFCLCQKTG